MFDFLWPIVSALLVASPLMLPLLKDGELDKRSLLIAGSMTVVALAMPIIGFGDAGSVWKFMLAQTLLFASFVCISRVRNRKSLFLTALAGVGSNGGWFLAMQVLAGAYLAQQAGFANSESLGLLTAAIMGTLAGRLVGVQWMMWVEKRWQVRTDSVGSSSLRWFDERTQVTLRYIFVGTAVVYAIYGSLTESVSVIDVATVMVLGFVQSNVYTINARFANRNHPGWTLITGIVASVIIMIHFAYLMSYTQAGGFMPMVLAIPYTVATVYGANAGAVLSMFMEKLLGLKADGHVKKTKEEVAEDEKKYAKVVWHWYVLTGTAVLCSAYLVMSEQILVSFGFAVNTIILPFTLFAGTGWERPASLILGGLLFFVNNITHTASSRAGNRNHAPYHAVTCAIHGVVTFGTGTFVVLNAHFMDLVPLAVLGSALGQLVAQKWSMMMELRLGSVMDLPETELEKIRRELQELLDKEERARQLRIARI